MDRIGLLSGTYVNTLEVLCELLRFVMIGDDGGECVDNIRQIFFAEIV